jgi:alpha-glucosidase
VEKLVRVFVSPPGVDYVSDLPFVTERNGWGPVERDTSNGENQGGDGGPLRIRGTEFDKGLGVHALSEVTVDIGGAYERFTAQVGLDDEVSGPGSVVFEVIADGALLARTGVLTRADPPQPIDVDVTDVQTLTLRVTDGGDGINFDHGDWGDAQLRGPGA